MTGLRLRASGAWKPARTARLLASTAPSAPTVTTTVGGNRAVTVNWSAPASTGGAPIESYTVTLSPGGSATTVPAGCRRATVARNLSTSTAYTASVVATNSKGSSPAGTGTAVSTTAGGFAKRTVSNTGVPSGSTLTPVGSSLTTIAMTVTVDGTVVDLLNLTGQLVIKANNVTVRRSRVTAAFGSPVTVLTDPTTGRQYVGTLFLDSEIIGVKAPGVAPAVGISADHYTARRVTISGTGDGFRWGNQTVLEDCWVYGHDNGLDSTGVRVDTPHPDGAQCTAGKQTTIRGCTFQMATNDPEPAYANGNSGVFLQSKTGPVDDILIEENFIEGGSYAIHGDDAIGGAVTNIVIRNNRARAQTYAFLPSLDRWTGPITHTGNVNDDNGAALD